MSADFLTLSTNSYIPKSKCLKYSKLVDRSNNVINLGLILQNMDYGKDIEMSIFEYSLLYIINGHYPDSLFYSVYTNKIEAMTDTIKNNPIIKQHINKDLINPKFIAFIPNQNLCPERWENIIKKQKHLEEYKKNIATTDLYTCPHCHKKKCITRVVQTRSSDEALTTFIICCVCGTTFKG